MTRRQQFSPRRRIVTFSILVAMSASMTYFMSLPWMDTRDQTWVRCEVINAKPQRGGNYSSVAWFVSIETSDCGKVAYSVGTKQDNVDALAESFEPGPYEFKFGKISQQQAAGERLVDRAASARSYRPLE